MRARIPATPVVVALVVLAGCGAAPLGPDEPPAGGVGGPTSSDVPDVATPTANGTLGVHFVNVGQSVATLVVGPTGETMLVDSGHFQDDGEHVLRYLRERGIDRLDYLVTSHGDADHVGGHAAVIEYFETEGDGVGAVYDPGIAASTATYRAYLDAVEAHDVTLYETRAGDDIPMEGVDVEVLGPPEPYLADRERNENSLVVSLAFGTTSFLLTGDAGPREEAYLVDAHGEALSATVLKAGHHGSRTSTGADLLDAADPATVVVSSAYDSPYGHPHAEVLDRLADRGIPTYWTATHGHVVFESDGRQVRVLTQAAAPTDPGRLREGEPVEPGDSSPVERRATVAGGAVRTATGGTPPPAPTDGPTATDGGTPAPTATAGRDGDLALVEVHADAAGADGENLNDEYLVLENDGDEALALGGWTVADEAGHTYTFPGGFELPPGERVTVHTGSGEDAATDLYWGRESPVWNNGGDSVVVRNDGGTVVLEEAYG